VRHLYNSVSFLIFASGYKYIAKGKVIGERMSTSSPFPDQAKLALNGQLLAVLESIDSGFMILSPCWCCTYVNHAAENILHKQREDLLGKNLWQAFPEMVGTAFWKACCETTNARTIMNVEDVYFPNGQRVAFHISPSETGVVLSFHETTQSWQSIQTRRHHRLNLSTALVESAAIPIIGKTREGIITSWNRAAEQMYGYSAQEAVGQPITIIFPADRQDEFVRIMERITQGEQVDLYETTRRRKDGTILSVSVTISPIHDSEGRIIGASDIAHDITERKRIEAQKQFLIEVSKVLSSTLGYQETLANIARLVVPKLADWFTVDLVDREGHFELIEVVHKDPEKVRWARALRERYPIDPNASLGVPQVARRGQAELYTDIPDELLVAAARSEEELTITRQIGYSSAMIVPLIARGKTVGVISFVATESGKKYDRRDLALAEEIGRRAGVALDNAQLYREAQQSRDQLDIILQGVADGIIVYTADNQIMYANEAAARASGYISVQEMLTVQQAGLLNKYDLIDEQGQLFPCSQLTHLRVFAGEPEAQSIIGYREKGGSQPEQWSLVKSRPVRGKGGEVEMVVTITRDITERMSIERRKDEFISMTSHELKTPVTSLKGFTNVLQRRLTKQRDEQGLHYLARMDAQLDKLTDLISELLDISRIQSGKLSLRAEPFDLDALIEETVENVQATTSTHHLHIKGRADTQVLGDKERLGQVFINLLTNAIKYSPRADKVIVHLSRDEEGQQTIVSVQDFGIGIDEIHHKKIFERFYQVTDPEEKTYPGLGIGLYISSEIVARHQGRIWVESSKGKGATFSVALPLLPSRDQAGPQ
jgi:PAS domain S-box-containing protein